MRSLISGSNADKKLRYYLSCDDGGDDTLLCSGMGAGKQKHEAELENEFLVECKGQPYKMGGWRRAILQKITHTSFIHSFKPTVLNYLPLKKKWRSLLGLYLLLRIGNCSLLRVGPGVSAFIVWNKPIEKTLIVLAFRTHSASPDVVDDVLARDELSFSHSLREIEDVHARNADEVRILSILPYDFRFGTHSLNLTSHLDTLRQTRYRKAREVRSNFYI